MSERPTVHGFSVSGHYKSLKPEHVNSRTISDGTMFMTMDDAIRYAKEKMYPGARVTEWEWEASTRGWSIPLDFHARRCVRVCFENGDHLITEINGTLESIEKYYIGTRFNMGAFPVENMVRATCVQLDPCRGTYTDAYAKSVRTWEEPTNTTKQ